MDLDKFKSKNLKDSEQIAQLKSDNISYKTRELDND
jgi:hypothetical protein